MKIRTDFVTNSSSSSFVCFGVFDEELTRFVKKLIEDGYAVDRLREKVLGEEVCSVLFFYEEGIITQHQIGGFFKPEEYLKVESLWSRNNKYTKADSRSDMNKLNKVPEYVYDSISYYFKNLTDKQKEKLKKLTKKAYSLGESSCRVYLDQTDGTGCEGMFNSEIRAECKANSSKVKEEKEKLKAAKENLKKEKEYVTLGSYAFDASGNKQPIEWQVLKEEPDKTLLISRYIIDFKPYDDSGRSVKWENCSIRGWLNEYFLNEAFSNEEKAKIIDSRVTADPVPGRSSNQGKETVDKVFLISALQASELFVLKKERVCLLTEYAKTFRMERERQNTERWAREWNNFTEEDARQHLETENNRYAVRWYLRSAGNEGCAEYVKNDGSLSVNGQETFEHDGIRPAIWIKKIRVDVLPE